LSSASLVEHTVCSRKLERNDLLRGVLELRLFGSMLDPKAETIGDVEVAYKLYDKPPPSGKKTIRKASIGRAAAINI
jgi:hypothetical protein